MYFGVGRSGSQHRRSAKLQGDCCEGRFTYKPGMGIIFFFLSFYSMIISFWTQDTFYHVDNEIFAL